MPTGWSVARYRAHERNVDVSACSEGSAERVELLDENNNKMKCPDFSEYIEGVRDEVFEYIEASDVDPSRKEIEEYVKGLFNKYGDYPLTSRIFSDIIDLWKSTRLSNFTPNSLTMTPA